MPPPHTPQTSLQVDGSSHPEAVAFPFSLSQGAAALAVIKSLPEGRTIEEQLASFQRNALRDPNAPQASRPYHLFNTIEYWKEEYEKLWRENKSLKDEVLVLKRQYQHRSRTPQYNHQLDGSQESQEAPEENRSEGRASRKRPSVEDYLEEFSFLRTNEASSHRHPDSFIHTVGIHIHKIMINREHLGTLLESAGSLLEIDILANFAPSVCLNLNSTLSECFLAVPYLKTDDESKHTLGMLQRISDLTIASFISVFRALDKISQTIEGRKRKGTLVYQMAQFFKRSFDLLHTLSNMQAEYEKTNRNLRSKKARVQEAEYVANKHLGRILSAIVYNLEWKETQSVHSDLLEGILYVVLDHTGTILSNLTFGEHVAASKNPGNITENDGNVIPEEISKHEMQYAIQILHNAIGGSDKKELFLQVLAAGKKTIIQNRVGASGTIAVPPGDMFKKAKVKLQSTLLKTTLGYDETESLHPPSVPEDVSDLVDDWDAEEMHGPRWFVAQMWSLIGWDLVD